MLGCFCPHPKNPGQELRALFPKATKPKDAPVCLGSSTEAQAAFDRRPRPLLIADPKASDTVLQGCARRSHLCF